MIGESRDLLQLAGSSPLRFLLPVALIMAGLVAGIIVERITVSSLGRIGAKTSWRGYDIISGALERMITIWFLIAGIYFAEHSISLDPRISGLAQKLLLTATIVSVTWSSAKMAGGFINFYIEKTEGDLVPTSIFSNATKLIVIIIGILILLQSLGVAITPLITALGVGGLAVALALQETFSNLASGFQIIASKQIRPGDYIKLDTGEEGYVSDINWRNTTIRALPNNLIVVPNAKLAQAIVRNYYLPDKEVAVAVDLGVSYDSDLDQVESVTIEVAKGVMEEFEGGIAGFEPVVRYHTFSDSSIDFKVVMRVSEFVDQYPLKHEFIKQLHKRYQSEGIEIPFPVRKVYLREETAKH